MTARTRPAATSATRSHPAALVPAAQDPRIPTLHHFEICFGIPISDIGEDGVLIALGHHDPKAALAAFNAHARRSGVCDLLDGRGTRARWMEALDGVRHRWAVQLVGQCRTCAREGARDECGVCADVAEATEMGSWCLDYSAAETEDGAFPVTVWSA
jgi:hypothetical protein